MKKDEQYFPIPKFQLRDLGNIWSLEQSTVSMFRKSCDVSYNSSTLLSKKDCKRLKMLFFKTLLKVCIGDCDSIDNEFVNIVKSVILSENSSVAKLSSRTFLYFSSALGFLSSFNDTHHSLLPLEIVFSLKIFIFIFKSFLFPFVFTSSTLRPE